jgi:uncharacterized protein (DUF302 family)
MTADGLVSIRSHNGPQETMNQLDAEVKARGMTVFARIDHAAGAAAVGLPLRRRRHGRSAQRPSSHGP